MKLSKMINEGVDAASVQLEEGFFNTIMSHINDLGIGNKEKKKVKAIQKNLTKQIWSRFYLFKKKKKKELQQKGLNVMIMDKAFFDEFMKLMDVEQVIVKQVYDQVGKEIRKMDKLYTGYRSKKISDEEMQQRIDNNGKALTVFASDVINAIALASSLQYMNQYLDSDLTGLPDGVLRSGVKSMRKATSSFSNHMFGAIAGEIQKRSPK